MFEKHKGGYMPPTPPDAELLVVLRRQAEQMQRDFDNITSQIIGDNVAFKTTFNEQFLAFKNEVFTECANYAKVMEGIVRTLSESLDGKYGSVSEELQKIVDAHNLEFRNSVDEAMQDISERFELLSEGYYDDFASLRTEVETRLGDVAEIVASALKTYSSTITEEVERIVVESVDAVVAQKISEHVDALRAEIDTIVSTKLDEGVSDLVDGKVETLRAELNDAINSKFDENLSATVNAKVEALRAELLSAVDTRIEQGVAAEIETQMATLRTEIDESIDAIVAEVIAEELAAWEQEIDNTITTAVSNHNNAVDAHSSLFAAKANKAVSFSVSLFANSWSNNRQTISDSRFVANGYVYHVAPASGSFIAYGDARIYAVDVTSDGSITFVCGGDVPTDRLDVNIDRFEVKQ